MMSACMWEATGGVSAAFGLDGFFDPEYSVLALEVGFHVWPSLPGGL